MDFILESSSENEEDEQNRVQRVRCRRPRTFRPRINFNFITIFEFNQRFRSTSLKLEELVNIIGAPLQHETGRNHALSSRQQVQVALHWFGTGCQYHAIGDMHGLSKATVHRCIKNVTSAINRRLTRNIIRWPRNLFSVIRKFHQIAELPMVVGVVDGILINIDAPTVDEEGFVDRYGDHSINVMGVCGPDYNFYYINSNWPGSVHNARVLRNSSLYRSMEAGWRPIANGYTGCLRNKYINFNQ
ncbi:hypothetical protein Zmor_013546 [Zophobas morio]|uniref:Putative nuclease HARBI1 n=1 Tax=Zophobas morio TaxID=2755281 RepID=A0AA38MFE6_9CUCU|nr:hypothetical protein Zmor_013546 [Zophobas morio]